MTSLESNLESAYVLAKERYAALGVDTDQAIARLNKISISLHCWQGDDVGGFENPGGELTGGIAATDEHEVVALDANQGKTRWTFRADGALGIMLLWC